MNWFFIALLNPIAHALVNHIDKYLIQRFMKGGSVGALVLFSSLFAVFALPVIYLINPNVLSSVSTGQTLALMLNGGMLVAAYIFYFYALEADEASYVAPLFQLVPVFGFTLGYFALGETLSLRQCYAAALIIVGGLLLSLELGGQTLQLKKKVLILMILSSLFYAINAVVFKSIANTQGFVDSLFWDMAGKFVFGILVFLFVRSYRQQFLHVLKVNGPLVIGINVVNEILALIGEVALVLAVMFAPIALVQSVGGLQAFFVLLFGILLTVLFPKFTQESLHIRALAQKICGVVIITLGVYWLGVA